LLVIDPMSPGPTH